MTTDNCNRKVTSRLLWKLTIVSVMESVQLTNAGTSTLLFGGAVAQISLSTHLVDNISTGTENILRLVTLRNYRLGRCHIDIVYIYLMFA